MKIYTSDDYETPLEERPGVVGYTWDGEFFPHRALASLKGFDWGTYRELIDETGRPRQITLSLIGGITEVSIDPYDDIAYLLDQCPSVNVFRDNGPPDAGPASGSGFIFFVADGATIEQLEHEMRVLRTALDEDFLKLSSRSPGKAAE
jgi:hypothetical protein